MKPIRKEIVTSSQCDNFGEVQAFVNDLYRIVKENRIAIEQLQVKPKEKIKKKKE